MLATPLTDLLRIKHPVLLAPMADISGAALAGAVSQAGGLGLLGGGYCKPDWVAAELDRAEGARVGIGFITWALEERPQVLDLALAHDPAAVMRPSAIRRRSSPRSRSAASQSSARCRASKRRGRRPPRAPTSSWRRARKPAATGSTGAPP